MLASERPKERPFVELKERANSEEGVGREKLDFQEAFETAQSMELTNKEDFRDTSTVKILQTVNPLPWSSTGDYTVDQCNETTLKTDFSSV